jgi:hypothetical protein
MLLGTEGVLNTDEKINSSGLSRQLVTSLASKVQPQQVPRTNDAISSDSANPNENPILGGRVFSPPVVSGVQWRPQAAATFQNQRKLYVPLLLILFLLYSPIASKPSLCRISAGIRLCFGYSFPQTPLVWEPLALGLPLVQLPLVT